MRARYRVDLIEYERGWGQNHFSSSDFETKKEADDYVISVNSRNVVPTASDYYIQADDPYLVDLDRVDTHHG